MNNQPTSDVVVIGGGIAGSSCAFALARRGHSVRLVESAPHIAAKASGNRFALITPYITSRPSTLAALYADGIAFSHQLLAQNTTPFTQCGALQLPATGRLMATLQDDSPLLGDIDTRRISDSEASAIAGVPISSPAFFTPRAGYLSPRDFVSSLLSQFPERISTSTDTRVISLAREKDSWRVLSADGRSFRAPTVVICGAYESSALEPSKWLPLEPIRGQTISLSASPITTPLRCILNFGGYIVPAVSREHVVGAHYRHNDLNEDTSATDTDAILDTCNRWIPSLQLSRSMATSARVCFRTSTLDRVPYIGKIPHFEEMKAEASKYQPGTDLAKAVPMRFFDGLYINAGHGSRGMLTCPIGGEIIARLICKEPLATLERAATGCCPSRLPYRLLTRTTTV